MIVPLQFLHASLVSAWSLMFAAGGSVGQVEAQYGTDLPCTAFCRAWMGFPSAPQVMVPDETVERPQEEVRPLPHGARHKVLTEVRANRTPSRHMRLAKIVVLPPPRPVFDPAPLPDVAAVPRPTATQPTLPRMPAGRQRAIATLGGRAGPGMRDVVPRATFLSNDEVRRALVVSHSLVPSKDYSPGDIVDSDVALEDLPKDIALARSDLDDLKYFAADDGTVVLVLPLKRRVLHVLRASH